MVPLFDTMIEQKSLYNNVISYSYVYKDEERYGFKSQMQFGNIDKSLYTGELKWYPIVDNHYMTVQIDDILFNNKSFGYCGKTNETACFLTADTGMSYMSVPEDFFAIMQARHISDVQECDPKIQIGTFTILMGKDRIDMPPSDW